MIGITPAFGSIMTRTIIDIPHAEVLREVMAGIEEEGLKLGQLAQPVRVALTGRAASPGLFEVMEVLGRDRTLFRLRKGIERASGA